MDNRQYNKKKVSFSDTFNDGPVAYLPFQTFLHIVHRLFQAAVHDPRIMLRHACGGMSEHDGHVLQGYIVGERDGRPESVPGHVRGQVFLYAAEIGDFLEVAVHFLVAHDRQHPFFTQIGCSLYFSNMASGTGSSGMLLMEDAFLRCSNLTLPFLIHQSPRLSCTRFSPLRVATSENARPVKQQNVR